MNRSRLVVIILLFITLCIFLLLISTNNKEFSRYNPGWDGTSQFFDLQDRHFPNTVNNLSQLSNMNNSCLLIIAPEEQYSSNQTEYYRKFLLAGNTIILADDFGTGNSLLKGIGSHISILPGTLSSFDRAMNDSYLVVTNPEDIDHPMIANVSNLVLDKSATLIGGEPLISSSLFSWIDSDGNHQITNREILGKYSVMAHEKIGDGEIIVLSDPSVFINSMINLDPKWGNTIFIENLINSNSYFYLDQINSKTHDADIVSGTIGEIKSIPDVKIIIAGIILLIISIIYLKNGKKHD